MLGPEAKLDCDICPQQSVINRSQTPQPPLAETLAHYAARQPELESRAEKERNRGADGVFEGCRLTSGPCLPTTQRSPCIASLRHGVQTTDTLAASVAKPPSQTALGG